MTDFKTARTNMVDCQIHTAGVVHPEMLEAFNTIPRELFVPEALKNIAYGDETIAAGKGRYLLKPVAHAKMLEAVEPKLTDNVLDIGGGGGYSAAIMAGLVRSVVALDDAAFIPHAQATWAQLKLSNVQAMAGDLTRGCPQLAPFDIIFLNGAVTGVPESLLAQMAVHGRLIAVIRQPGRETGQITLFKKSAEGGVSSYPLFETGAPYLPGFEPKTAFHF
jgi:protein-L-isoaspartate(D-aspartate) O-methyltransferase